MSGELYKLTSIRVHAIDGHDSQLWVQSSISPTHKLPRGTKDDFSFTRKDILVLPNVSESEPVTVSVECLKAAESGVLIGSNRRGARAIREGETFEITMRPREVLTVRSVDMVEPVGRHADGSPIEVRAGHNVAAP